MKIKVGRKEGFCFGGGKKERKYLHMLEKVSLLIRFSHLSSLVLGNVSVCVSVCVCFYVYICVCL